MKKKASENQSRCAICMYNCILILILTKKNSSNEIESSQYNTNSNSSIFHSMIFWHAHLPINKTLHKMILS